MKKVLFVAALAAMLALPAYADGFTFTAVDTDGNTVTDAILSQADLTIVNVWGTECPPCISELPDLQTWSAELPENAQLIGIVYDVTPDDEAGLETVRKILEKAGVTYTNILYDASLDSLISGMIGTPTTYFLNSEGVEVHESVLGSYMDQYKAAADEVLSK